jgi:hypothetical protein
VRRADALPLVRERPTVQAGGLVELAAREHEGGEVALVDALLVRIAQAHEHRQRPTVEPLRLVELALRLQQRRQRRPILRQIVRRSARPPSQLDGATGVRLAARVVAARVMEPAEVVLDARLRSQVARLLGEAQRPTVQLQAERPAREVLADDAARVQVGQQLDGAPPQVSLGALLRAREHRRRFTVAPVEPQPIAALEQRLRGHYAMRSSF